MQGAHRVAKNTGILYARMFVTMFITLYVTRLLLEDLGVEDFGLFNVVGGLISMLGFLNTSMSAATQRFMSIAQGSGDLEQVKRIFNTSTYLHIVIGLILVIVFEIAGYFFLNGILKISPVRIESAKIIYQFMIISTFFTVLTVPYEAVITSNENMLLYAVLSIIETIFKLFIAIFISYSSYDHLETYGFLTAMVSIFLLLIRIFYCHKKYDECTFKLTKYYYKPLLKEMSGFAGWTLLGTTTSMLSIYGQGIVINVFFGAIINASQAIANQISGQLSTIAVTMQKALNPMLGKSEGGGNRTLMINASMVGSKISVFLIMIPIIPIIIEMPLIFSIWLKETPDFAIIFCRLILIRILIEQYHNVLVTSIIVVGNIKKFEIINSLFNISPLFISYFLFLNGFDSTSLYIVFIICTFFKTGGVIYFAKINCSLSISKYIKSVILPSIYVLFIVVIVSLVPSLIIEKCLSRTISTFVVALTASFLTIWIIGLSHKERNELKLFKNYLIKSFIQ
jgi:O-antigen/teichoic acid export membrane protein